MNLIIYMDKIQNACSFQGRSVDLARGGATGVFFYIHLRNICWAGEGEGGWADEG